MLTNCATLGCFSLTVVVLLLLLLSDVVFLCGTPLLALRLIGSHCVTLEYSCPKL